MKLWKVSIEDYEGHTVRERYFENEMEALKFYEAMKEMSSCCYYSTTRSVFDDFFADISEVETTSLSEESSYLSAMAQDVLNEMKCVRSDCMMDIAAGDKLIGEWANNHISVVDEKIDMLIRIYEKFSRKGVNDEEV